MPRKEDGMLFEVHPTPLKDKDGNNYVYAKPMGGLRLSMQDLDAYCSNHYAVQSGEMTRTIRILMDAVKTFLADGYRIETPMGAFAPRIGLCKEYTDADTIDCRDVRLQGIEFQPSKEFMEMVQLWNRGFRRAPNADTRALMADERHLRQALQRSIVANNGFTNIRSFMMHSGLTYHSARKQLDQWCKGQQALLMRTKMGPSFVYTEI